MVVSGELWLFFGGFGGHFGRFSGGSCGCFFGNKG